MRKYLAIFVLLLFAGPCHAQATFDAFGGMIHDSGGANAPVCTAPPHQQAATCSRSLTTVTCTVTDGTKYVVNEPILITGTGTGEDWTYDGTDPQAGASIITGIATNTITLTSHTSGTVAATAGTFTPARTYTQIVNGAWRFCTPGFNHELFWIPMGAAQCGSNANCASNSYVATKYGSVCAAVSDLYAQFLTWDFTGIGMDSFGYDPTANGGCASNAKFLFFTEEFTAAHATDNLYGSLPQAIKDIQYGMDSHNVCPVKRPLLDSFSNVSGDTISDYHAFNVNQLSQTVYVNDYKSPFYIGFTNNDQGNIATGAGVGGDFHVEGFANIGAHNDCDSAVQIAIASPHQTWSFFSDYGSNAPFVYADTKVYSKTLSASAPGACWTPSTPTVAPCSWPDFVRFTYTTVAAMNAAWGSSYTTFGSSESVFSGETFFTGAGLAPGQRTHTTTNTNVTPLNVQITLTPSGGAATAIGGDCAQFTSSKNFNGTVACGSTLGTGILAGPPVWQASNAYPANHVITDKNGNVQKLNAAGTSGSNVPAWSTTVGAATTDGALTWTMLGAGIGTPTVTISGATTGWAPSTAYSTGFEFINMLTGDVLASSTGGTSGTTVPTWPLTLAGTVVDGTVTWANDGVSKITYATGAMTLQSNVVMQTGATWKVNYSTGGWAANTHGTGLEDEDGLNTWTGAGVNGTYISPVNKPAYQTSHAYNIADIVFDSVSHSWQYATTAGTSGGSAPAFSATQGVKTNDGATLVWDSEGQPVVGSTPSDFPASTMNQAMAAVVENFYAQYAAMSLSADSATIKTLYPDLLYFGPDQLGGYDTPASIPFMQADQVYADVGFVNLGDPSITPNANDELQFTTKYVTHPLFPYENYASTQSDAPSGCFFGTGLGSQCYTSQALRGAAWYSLLSWMNTQVGFNGVKPWAGSQWWGSHTFQGTAWGLKTATFDNAYDAHEDVSTSVSCSAPNGTLTCGGESGTANFLSTDGIFCAHCVRDANALWFQSSITIPTVPVGREPGLALHFSPMKNPVSVKDFPFHDDWNHAPYFFF